MHRFITFSVRANAIAHGLAKGVVLLLSLSFDV